MIPFKYRYWPGIWFDFDKYYSHIARTIPDNSNVVELGVFWGSSICHLAKEIKRYNKKCKIYAVDNYKTFSCHNDTYDGQSNYNKFLQNLHESHVENDVISIVGDRLFFDNIRYSSIDFSFIDADHELESVMSDIRSIWPKIKQGGILSGHDYQYNGVKYAVDCFFYNKEINYYNTEKQTKIWEVIKKRRKLIVIVPYRNRQEHLTKFIPYINEYLSERNFDYKIVVVEQLDDKPWNRGKLLNIGYTEFKDEADYFCFHDVDLIPDDADYSYPYWPTHLATMAEQHGYKLPYETYFGGVSLFNKEHFEQVNGFHNEFWIHGGEDDDSYNRCIHSNLTVEKRWCIFWSLPHKKSQSVQENIDRLNRKEYNNGLSNLKYNLKFINTKDGYIHIGAEL